MDKDKDAVAGRAPSSDQALKPQQGDGDGGATGPQGTPGQLDPLVVAGVALYVGTVYALWQSFRAYFDWSESLAISFIVRISLL